MILTLCVGSSAAIAMFPLVDTTFAVIPLIVGAPLVGAFGGRR